MKKILLFGNHTCANRGDAAISRGLIELFSRRYPSASLLFYTRFVGAGRYVLQRDCLQDPFSQSLPAPAGLAGLLGKIVRRELRPLFLYLRARSGWRWLDGLLPDDVRAFIAEVRSADVFVQVGGSFFVDLYGLTQYEGVLVALAERTPVLLLGHSVGPFNGWWYRQVSSFVFSHCDALLLREPESFTAMQAAAIPVGRVVASADAAWLVQETGRALPPAINDFLQSPCVAITVRDIGPFAARLGVTPVEYEAAVLQVARQLLAAGLHLVFASTCTDLDHYGRDDRVVARRMAASLQAGEQVLVVEDELDDLQLGELYRRCRLVLATRLHSAIIAMRCGTPAVALYYEHKSEGILRQMGLGDYSLRISELPAQADRIVRMADDDGGIRARVQQGVADEIRKATSTIEQALDGIGHPAAKA